VPDCPRQAENLKQCNCSYAGCGKKGRCCECLHYHRRMGQLPACFFSAKDEKSYDRSIERFIAAHS
jgi:hypothetical protein